MTTLFATELPLSEWDNGYKESQFDRVLNRVKSEFSREAKIMGKKFVIESIWWDGSVNAYSWVGDTTVGIEIPGGLARHSLITENAFILIICHELGHIFGGNPKKYNVSVEGQADYYSTKECFKRLYVKKDSYYHDAVGAIKSVTNLYARASGDRPPKMGKKDPNRVKKTLSTHPSIQCRMDTLIAGLKKEVRPACWYKNKNF